MQFHSQQSNDFIKHLPNASLISMDEEMTGIMLPPGMAGRPSKEDTPSDRYSTLKQIPERYSMIQLGICLFEAQDQNQKAPPSSTTATASTSPTDNSSNTSNNDPPSFLVVRNLVCACVCVCVEHPLSFGRYELLRTPTLSSLLALQ
jgi:hypothetical protein